MPMAPGAAPPPLSFAACPEPAARDRASPLQAWIESRPRPCGNQPSSGPGFSQAPAVSPAQTPPGPREKSPPSEESSASSCIIEDPPNAVKPPQEGMLYCRAEWRKTGVRAAGLLCAQPKGARRNEEEMKGERRGIFLVLGVLIFSA